ncbi:MAG: efflux RND transporter periplasmic adaptor subunit, partial [Anaerolineae bacterium]|nr:efflux RND transporter periplasmic adaptor subunit [Anaerolineae bacterium]
ADLARAEADLAAAEAELAAANLKLRLAQQAGLAPLEQAVADDELALRVARDQLRLTELNGSEATISALEYDQAFYQRVLRDLKPGEDPTAAQNALATIERDLASARAAREEQLRQAADTVAKAEEKLARSQAALARARAGQEDPTAEARLACEQANEKVDRARNAVEDLKAGVDSAAVRAARTNLEAAQARVDGAKAAIAEATLTAPFAGTVYAVSARLNEQVQPGALAVYLADPTDLRVQAQATEMDIARLAVGQEVRVTLDAFPGRLFSGRVLVLPAKGQADAGVAYYQIETSLDPGDAELFAGMTANVRVVVGQKDDALLVPVAALQYRSPDDIYVTVQAPDGKARQQNVRIGLNDGIVAEVLEGLSEGETVLLPLVPPTEPRRFGPYMGPMY